MASSRKVLRVIQRTISERKCGTCTACCTVQAVEEIEKPAGVPCQHLGSHKGCAIYEDRPSSCKEWQCGWKLGMVGSEHRPDRAGIVLDLTGRAPDLYPRGYAVLAREAFPGGFEKAAAILSDLARNHIVILVDGDVRKLIGPPGEVELVRARMAQAGIMT